MSMRNYLILCVLLAAVTALAVLLIPGLGETIERVVLGFLSRNAR